MDVASLTLVRMVEYALILIRIATSLLVTCLGFVSRPSRRRHTLGAARLMPVRTVVRVRFQLSREAAVVLLVPRRG